MRTLFMALLLLGTALFVDGFANDFRGSREIAQDIKQLGHEAEARATQILRGFSQH